MYVNVVIYNINIEYVYPNKKKSPLRGKFRILYFHHVYTHIYINICSIFLCMYIYHLFFISKSIKVCCCLKETLLSPERTYREHYTFKHITVK